MTSKRNQRWLLGAGLALPIVLTGAGPGDKPHRERPDGPPKPEAMMERLDQNADGALTQDEVPAQLWERLQKADADGNGAVTVEELAAQRPRPDVRPGPEQMFERFDQNQDGQVTADEAPEGLWAKIQKADADGNGGVTLDELKAFRPEGDRRGGPGGAGPEALFKEHDANQDGKLTQDEVPAELWDKLSRADKNQDGAIEPGELRRERPDGPGGPGGLFERFDANQDGQLTQDEVPAEAWEKLSRGDKNGDGAIQRDELPQRPEGRGGEGGATEMFKRFDANQDGQLTPDELPEQLRDKIGRVDKNGDGVITPDELHRPEKAKHKGDQKDRGEA